MRKTIILILLIPIFGFQVSAQDALINIMPYPREVKTGPGKHRIDKDFIVMLSASKDDKIIEDAVNRFVVRLRARTLVTFQQERIVPNELGENAKLSITVKSKAVPSIGIDESYQIDINEKQISLNANTSIGALRGLETLLQLVSADEAGYYLPNLQINDTPRFKWRGMMVDVARHFLPVSILKKQIDAMAIVKLNVLHVHLSDDDGFRVESKLFPKLHELGSNGRYFTQTELKDLVKYASDRGIIIVPEFDVPGHTRSWLAGYPEFASQPGPYKPGPRFQFDANAKQVDLMKAVMSGPTPTIDPTREEVYKFFDKFFGEMAPIFPSPYLHIGADENNGAAWNTNPKIAQFMKDKGMKDTHELQSYFVKRLYDLVKKNNRTTITWQEGYSEQLPKDIIVQAWIAPGGYMKATPPLEIAQKGNQVLISTGSYLDLFMPSHIHYINQNIPSDIDKNVLGGEAALWSELVDENSFETRAWPRAASIAERLWSPSTVYNVDDMYRRLYVLSDRLEEAGLNHRLNIKRMLSELANGTDLDAPLTVLETISPYKGYRRLAGTMMQPLSTKYETKPLVDLPDFAEVDSEFEWSFRNQIASYLKGDNPDARKQIETTLLRWKAAADRLSQQVRIAPNLKSLNAFSERIITATDIGLQALDKPFDETKKTEVIKQLRSMKAQTDVAEIRILDEIEALVNGKLDSWPASYGAF